MLYRSAYIAKDEGLGDSGTKTFNIDVQDPITSIWLEMQVKNSTAWNHHNPMHENVSGIELIDGGDVIWSLDGEQLLAKVCADLGYWPHQRFSAIANDWQNMSLPIQFGRFHGDKVYALDPSQFKNLQLRVSWNLATNNAVGTTGFLSDSLTATVIADVMEGAPAPRGIITAQEVYTYTSAAGTEYISMPTDYPYLSIIWRSHYVGRHVYDMVTDFKLVANGGAYVPMDIGTEDLLRQLMAKQPRLSYRIIDHLSNGATFYSYLSDSEDVRLGGEDNVDLTCGYRNWEHGSRTVWVYRAGSAEGSNMNIGATVSGYLPFAYYVVPLGDPADPADWFQAPTFKKLSLELTGAVASGENAVCVVQERLYR